jgi:flagellar assembly protein FliH
MDVVQREQQAWMAQAKAELAAARDREEQAGRAAGFAKGQAEAQAAYRDRLQDLERLLAALGQAVERQVGGLEDLAVGVGFEVACKVLGERLVTREGVRALAEQVLVRVRTEEPVVLRLSPRDFSLLLQQPGEAPVTAPHRLELVPDERIELGGCMVETASGSLDARLETQIDALRHVLLDVQQRRR